MVITTSLPMWSYTQILFIPLIRSYFKNAIPATALKDNINKSAVNFFITIPYQWSAILEYELMSQLGLWWSITLYELHSLAITESLAATSLS